MELLPEYERSLLGDIYVGKVERVVPKLATVFVKIGKDLTCHMAFEDCRNPVFKTPGRGGSVRPGDELLVQVSREALKEKLPSVTGALCLTGNYLVATRGESYLGTSSKLSAAEKKRLKALLEPVLRPGIGLVVRTNAQNAPEDRILEEYRSLCGEMERICQQGVSRTCFSCLKKGAPAWTGILRHEPEGELEEIVTDLPEIFDEAMEGKHFGGSLSNVPVRLYRDCLQPLYKKYALESVIAQGLSEKVPLPSGGGLVIQQTEAFTAVDVNTGKYTGGQREDDLKWKTNLEAAREIAVQLRLRQISGIILIDFINMKDEKAQNELLYVLNGYLREDSSKAVAVDITKLQIAEVTRKKIRKSLREALQN